MVDGGGVVFSSKSPARSNDLKRREWAGSGDWPKATSEESSLAKEGTGQLPVLQAAAFVVSLKLRRTHLSGRGWPHVCVCVEGGGGGWGGRSAGGKSQRQSGTDVSDH